MLYRNEAIRIRSAAHAFEGKVFNVVSSCALDADAIEQHSQGDSEMKELLQAAPAPVSMIVGPNGELLADPRSGVNFQAKNVKPIVVADDILGHLLLDTASNIDLGHDHTFASYTRTEMSGSVMSICGQDAGPRALACRHNGPRGWLALTLSVCARMP